MGEQMSDALDANKDALVVAAGIAAGRMTLDAARKVLGERVPEGTRTLLSGPLGDIVIANVLRLLQTTVAADNQMFRTLSDGAMRAAMVGLVDQWDLNGLVKSLTGAQ